MNYDGRRFRGRRNSANGEVGGETIFLYRQHGDVLTGEYSGGAIVAGHLLGTVRADGSLDFLYHHINERGELMGGRCESTPRVEDGLLVLAERWQWLTGDRSSGTSEVEEISGDESGSGATR